MISADEIRYIQAYSRIIGVKEDEVTNYAQRKGITSLVDNASQLLTTQTQKEKHKAFLDLYRMSSAIKNKNPLINSPESAATFFHSVMDKIYDQEVVAVAFLNTKNRVIDHEVISLGTINSSIVHPREVFRNAILNKAKAIILCHNHPSGDLTPSTEDHTLTQRLKETGNLIGISVIDHVIINGVNRDEVYSFRQNGVLEAPSEFQVNFAISEEKAPYRVHSDGIKEITEKLETGIRDFFSGEKYQDYLRTMSRFHHYSLNNTILIAMQKPEATLVAGFNRWKEQFERNVKKGEKGIRIIAPAPYKVKKQMEKLHPVTQTPMRDENDKILTEEVEVKIPMYRVVSVFDVSQTDGKELPQMAGTLTGDVQNYEIFMEALHRLSPVPIQFEHMNSTTDGYFHREKQFIALREGMSEVQCVSAAIHEVAHAKLHNYQESLQTATQDVDSSLVQKPKDRRTEEVEAESISYAVCTYFGIQTDENSFGYIASWSKDKELPELRASLEIINRTASELIKNVDQHVTAIKMERNIHNPEKQEMNQDEIELQKAEQLLTFRTADNQESAFPIQTEHLQSIKDIIRQNHFYGLINNIPPDSEPIVPKPKGRLTTEADVHLGHHEQRDNRKSLKQQLKKTAVNRVKSKSAPSMCVEMER